MDDGRNEGLARTLLLSFVVLVGLMWMGDQDNRANRTRTRITKNRTQLVTVHENSFAKCSHFVHFDTALPAPYLSSPLTWLQIGDGNKTNYTPPLHMPVIVNSYWCNAHSSEQIDCQKRSELTRIPIHSEGGEEYHMDLISDDKCNCDEDNPRCVSIHTSKKTGPVCVPDPQSDIIALVDEKLYYNSLATMQQFQWAANLDLYCTSQNSARTLFPVQDIQTSMMTIKFPVCHAVVDLGDNATATSGCKIVNSSREIYNSLGVLSSKETRKLIEIGFDALGALLIRGLKLEEFSNSNTFHRAMPESCSMSSYKIDFLAAFPGLRDGWIWFPMGDDTLVIATDGGQWQSTRIAVDLKTGKYSDVPLQSYHQH